MFDKCYSYSEDALALCKTRYLWVLDKHCDYSNFDFSWEPAPWESTFRHAFSSQWQKDSGTYLIPKTGYTETKYNTDNPVVRIPDSDKWDNMDADFDYSWHHDPSEPPYIYQFGTQHQKTGGPRYTVPDAKDTKFVGDITSKIRAVAGGAVLIKHLATKFTFDEDIEIISTTRFISNYLDTLKRVLKKIDKEYVWVISDLCDYSKFDFSWHPALWQNTMLHVFYSNEQKFGDTFFVHVPSFLENAKDIKLLEYYAPLNFVTQSVERVEPTFIKYDSDSVVDAVWKHEFVEPVVQFFRYMPVPSKTISLWQERLRTVVPLTKGSESVLVPRDAKNYIDKQVYDYEWIDKKHEPYEANRLCDIIFISNGESNAEQNWQHLNRVHTSDNRIIRVDGVKGRAEAYRAALEASNTDWAFCVFAKLEVNKDFDWTWQPDRLQQAKHYIFHAHNPVNGLEYGHMGMIAYNKKLVAINSAEGLDFTLDQAHEVVPILSGTARYADDPWIAWRSAFRECLKLKHSLPNIDSKYRLNQWLKADTTSAVAGWSAIGAQDAVDYYDAVDGNFTKLRLTYEWDWLAEYLFKQHNLTPDQLCTQLQDQSILDR